jgi:hypothetical protein
VAPGPLTQARTALAQALAPVGVAVYAEPQEAVTVPCLQITAGIEWIDGIRLDGSRARVQLTIRATVGTTGGNSKALESLETLVWDVLGVVAVQGPIQPPRFESMGQTDVLTVDMSTIVNVNNE